MKRSLLPAGALVLVLSACGAGHGPAPQVTRVGAHGHAATADARGVGGTKALAAAREAEAGHKADLLLRRLELPPGARRSALPAALSRPNLGVSVLTEFAYRHRTWKVHEPLAAVVSFLRAHRPRGWEDGVGGSSPVSLGFDQPPSHGWPMQGQLSFGLVARHGWTFVRADAGVAWIYPRSPREVVPAGVREIEIRGSNVDRAVTDAHDVVRIVHWFDELNVSPPGVHVMCMAELSVPVRFSFRSASGAVLAHAVVPSESADGCNPISFAVGGKAQAPLIDRRYGRYAFVERVQRLLGVCFRDPRRACR